MAETSAVKEKFLLFPDQKTLREQYNEFLENRKLAINKLQICVEEALRPMSSIPTVRTRVKDFESYFKKYLSLMEKDDPASHPYITDIIGIRVVCSFMEDLSVVEAILQEKFEVIEVERKGSEHTFREFGYESVHILIKLPKEIININSPLDCEVAEIQIRTILQDAWAEVEHELIYKSEFNPFDDPLKRKLAAVNASLSLADIIFQEIRGYIRNLNVQLEKRRESFFRKIEESTDDLLFMRKEGGLSGLHQENEDEQVCCLSNTSPSDSIDDLLLEALTAHNRNQFTQAIACYTRILELEPENNTVCSIIFKHRGMAFFARSHYEEALADFRKSLELDPKSYKAAYYEGIICSVLKDYPRALDAFNLALEINSYQPYCFYRRGQAYFHLEDYPKALADCEAALALESFDGAQKLKQIILKKLKM